MPKICEKFDLCEKVRMFFYLRTMKGKSPLPKRIRRVVAGTKFHRVWLQGHTGSFVLGALERI